MDCRVKPGNDGGEKNVFIGLFALLGDFIERLSKTF
jgi:hypothetical protein